MKKARIEINSVLYFVIDKKALKTMINQILDLIGKKFDTIIVNFLSDEQLLQLNKKHLNHDYYTDILTFKLSDEPIFTELLISYERAFENSKKFKTTFENEILRLIIHGLLHSIGLEDNSRSEKIKMRKAETKILNYLDKKNFIKKFKVDNKWQSI